jgi:hypothetical protein
MREKIMTDKKKHSKQPKTGNSFFTGLLVSILLGILYLKFGFTLPAWMQPFGAFKDILTDFAVSAVSDQQDLNEVQRKIALDFGWNRQKFVDLDTALGHFISEEYYWQQQGRGKILQLQNNIKKIKQETKKGTNQNLKDSFNRVLNNLPKKARQEHRFIRRHLNKRFPDDTDDDIITKLADCNNIDEIIQRPSISQTIHFQLIVEAKVRVEIMEIIDNSEKVIHTLIDARLPAGQYWVYWDRMGDSVDKSSLKEKYRYRVLYNDKLETTGLLEYPNTWLESVQGKIKDSDMLCRKAFINYPF